MEVNSEPALMLVLVSCADAEEAARIAAALLEARLAACASIGSPVQSRYWWQGQLETATEAPLTVKTTGAQLEAVEAAIRRLHSYAVPEIIAVRAESVSADYAAWLQEAMRPARPGA